jgi:hypothetical protein
MYSATFIPPSQLLLVYRRTEQGVQDTHPMGSRIGEYRGCTVKEMGSLRDGCRIKTNERNEEVV